MGYLDVESKNQFSKNAKKADFALNTEKKDPIGLLTESYSLLLIGFELHSENEISIWAGRLWRRLEMVKVIALQLQTKVELHDCAHCDLENSIKGLVESLRCLQKQVWICYTGNALNHFTFRNQLTNTLEHIQRTIMCLSVDEPQEHTKELKRSHF